MSENVLTDLIGACEDSVFFAAISRMGLNTIGHHTHTTSGRLQTVALTNDQYSGDGYFIDREGVEHELVNKTFTFPNGQTMSVLVPKDQS
jgi:hypothetical protein